MDAPFGGHVEPGFEGVQDAFWHNFEVEREHGAAFCLHVDGRKVVDIYGGHFDRANTRPYDQDTLQLVFSTTKGATAVCANLLAQRGQLDLAAPVATYWPEFAQAGKEKVTVLHLLSHQAGLPAIDRSAQPRRGAGLGPGLRGPGRPGPVLGAGHGPRLPRPHLRVVGR